MLKQRSELSSSVKNDYDRWVCNALGELMASRHGSIVHTYIPIASEINLRPLLEKLLQSGIVIVCPKVLPKRRFENRILASWDELEEGPMCTKYPAGGEVYSGRYDYIIVPGLAFDENKYRLGYGGGYYDTFLKTQPESTNIGVFYPFQGVEQVPLEEHDFRLNQILVKDFA